MHVGVFLIKPKLPLVASSTVKKLFVFMLFPHLLTRSLNVGFRSTTQASFSTPALTQNSWGRKLLHTSYCRGITVYYVTFVVFLTTASIFLHYWFRYLLKAEGVATGLATNVVKLKKFLPQRLQDGLADEILVERDENLGQYLLSENSCSLQSSIFPE